MTAIDWSPIFKKYKGKWVALKDDEETVVGVGDTLDKALEGAKKKGYENPILFKVPIEVLPYVGGF
ncbi:MAG: hypothetical protein A2Y57_02395 [Candidatus Woykebacteria bacterium RBG_13_40_7b]|uniref:DUF5678 domain-containing protein n=1 Tax=Candidatus Woykebacteria bacterium RBG_13_40_7b TaxID=1802594 RepID=A0A1G1WBE6_9BACT|nr:MAG: hypothetical protein A2Y57_02395 [Candidatus Woykebacteria bacterium RBG_13_40_7b]